MATCLVPWETKDRVPEAAGLIGKGRTPNTHPGETAHGCGKHRAGRTGAQDQVQPSVYKLCHCRLTNMAQFTRHWICVSPFLLFYLGNFFKWRERERDCWWPGLRNHIREILGEDGENIKGEKQYRPSKAAAKIWHRLPWGHWKA